MLKFLTHKLRTHSLNEESASEKVEGRDSGTESDDEAERAGSADPPGDFCADVIMKWNDVTDISMSGAGLCAGEGAATLALPPHPDPDHLYDHHSSEEELEVINGLPAGAGGAAGAAGPAAESRRRGASSPPPAAPEKRKWPAQPYLDADADGPAARAPSSDDDDSKVETPVRFRTSPPLEALKPRRAGGLAGGPGGAAGASPAGAAACSLSAPARAPLSPRRRRVALPPPRRHRPALDFDKMQQLRVGGGGGVRSWRGVGGAAHAHGGAAHAHGGELSVFCW